MLDWLLWLGLTFALVLCNLAVWAAVSFFLSFFKSALIASRRVLSTT